MPMIPAYLILIHLLSTMYVRQYSQRKAAPASPGIINAAVKTPDYIWLDGHRYKNAKVWSYVLSDGKLHADDTYVPVLMPGKKKTGRLWMYVRDDRNAWSEQASAIWFAYSPERKDIHPQTQIASPDMLCGRCLGRNRPTSIKMLRGWSV